MALNDMLKPQTPVTDTRALREANRGRVMTPGERLGSIGRVQASIMHEQDVNALSAAGWEHGIEKNKARILREGARINPRSLGGIRAARETDRLAREAESRQYAFDEREANRQLQRDVAATQAGGARGAGVEAAMVRGQTEVKLQTGEQTFKGTQAEKAHANIMELQQLNNDHAKGIQDAQSEAKMEELTKQLDFDMAKLMAEAESAEKQGKTEAATARYKAIAEMTADMLKSGFNVTSATEDPGAKTKALVGAGASEAEKAAAGTGSRKPGSITPAETNRLNEIGDVLDDPEKKKRLSYAERVLLKREIKKLEELL